MEPNPSAEELPALYRAVLDRVGAMEAAGQRERARLVRAEAIRIYSRSWDRRAQRELEALLRRHSGVLVLKASPRRALRRRILGTV